MSISKTNLLQIIVYTWILTIVMSETMLKTVAKICAENMHIVYNLIYFLPENHHIAQSIARIFKTFDAYES